jgi:hypothetical protein
VSGEASKYIGRPYDFWNLDLADTSAFYCSKLVWLAIRYGLGFDIDGDSNPKRAFWFSPKQLINEPGIELIVNPEPYFRGRGLVGAEPRRPKRLNSATVEIRSPAETAAQSRIRMQNCATARPCGLKRGFICVR